MYVHVLEKSIYVIMMLYQTVLIQKHKEFWTFTQVNTVPKERRSSGTKTP